MSYSLGLDIGTNSIGFAVLKNSGNTKTIEKLGVRIVPSDPNFHGKFEQGQTASKNYDRRLNRAARRNNQRFKARRNRLYNKLKELGMFPNQKLMDLPELELYGLRSRAASEKISLKELGRVLIHLNQKRGFKSSRKDSSQESNSELVKDLNLNNELLGKLTIGQYLYELKMEDPIRKLKGINFTRQKFEAEFDQIWDTQYQFYSEILKENSTSFHPNGLFDEIKNKIIFFQRKLKSAKHLRAFCTFEKYLKVTPKSNPIYQEFRLWKQLNELKFTNKYNEEIKIQHADLFKIYDALLSNDIYNKKGKVTTSKLKNLLPYLTDSLNCNYTYLDGLETRLEFFKAFKELKINRFDLLELYTSNDSAGPLFDLWHLFYSSETEEAIINTLQKRYGIEKEKALALSQRINFSWDSSSVSTKACRKLIPELKTGSKLEQALLNLEYQHLTMDDGELLEELELLKKNSLKNPVVEQILNQTINIVNALMEKYSQFDSIHVQLGKEVTKSASQRAKLYKNLSNTAKQRNRIKLQIQKDFDLKVVSKKDIDKYVLWEQMNKTCLYSGKKIGKEDLFSSIIDIDHIIPQSRFFDNSLSNKIIVFSSENKEKADKTAFDYIKTKGEKHLEDFVQKVNKSKLPERKKALLLTKGCDIKPDFIESHISTKQYIVRFTKELLEKVTPTVVVTFSAITNHLKTHWGLNELLKDINLQKYQDAFKTERVQVKSKSCKLTTKERIINWKKNDDHRYYAIEALITGLTSESLIKSLCTKNEDFLEHNASKRKQTDLLIPVDNLIEETKAHLENLIVSFKKTGTKLMSKKYNLVNQKGKVFKQQTLTPRGQLHKDTIYGKSIIIEEISTKDALGKVDSVKSPKIRSLLKDRLELFDGNIKKAKSSLNKKDILYKGQKLNTVKVWKEVHTKRVSLNGIEKSKIKKIINPEIKALVESYGQNNDLNNYNENPIIINKIPILKVTLREEGNLTKIPRGYVTTRSNHSLVVYKNIKGKLLQKVFSFWETTQIAMDYFNENQTLKGLNLVNYIHDLDQHIITLQKNDLVVFDDTETNLDAFSPNNIYRVQKFAQGNPNIVLRHIYESHINGTADFAFKSLRSLKAFDKQIKKININNIGELKETTYMDILNI
jgi:CRISPR-associated endonuclease Csn1